MSRKFVFWESSCHSKKIPGTILALCVRISGMDPHPLPTEGEVQRKISSLGAALERLFGEELPEVAPQVASALQVGKMTYEGGGCVSRLSRPSTESLRIEAEHPGGKVFYTVEPDGSVTFSSSDGE
jgi:hypothetical protein